MATWGLLRNPDFRSFWTADLLSQFGTRVAFLGVPLLATTTLNASATQVALLRALETSAYLVLGLQAGAWCDRLRVRPVLIIADLGRALLIASVPVCAAFGVLTLWQLFAVVLLTGLLTVFFDVAHQTYLPRLVDRGDLLEGNAKLQTNMSMAAVAAPTASGFLVQWLGAPAALGATALGYQSSAGWLARIRARETRPVVAKRKMRTEIGEGLRLVFRHPVLRALALSGASISVFQSMHIASSVVFLIRDIGLDPGAVGLLGTLGLTGALTGAFSARRLASALGHARALWLTTLLLGLASLLYPLTTPGWGLVFWCLAGFGTAFGVIVVNVLQLTYQQLTVPEELLGRANATVRFLALGMVPMGSVAAAALTPFIGLRATLWTAALGMLLSAGWVIFSPLRSGERTPSNTRTG